MKTSLATTSHMKTSLASLLLVVMQQLFGSPPLASLHNCDCVMDHCSRQSNAWPVIHTTESTHKCSKYVWQVQQQRPESPAVTLTWHERKYKYINSTTGTFYMHSWPEFHCYLYQKFSHTWGSWIDPCQPIWQWSSLSSVSFWIHAQAQSISSNKKEGKNQKPEWPLAF